MWPVCRVSCVRGDGGWGPELTRYATRETRRTQIGSPAHWRFVSAGLSRLELGRVSCHVLKIHTGPRHIDTPIGVSVSRLSLSVRLLH